MEFRAVRRSQALGERNNISPLHSFLSSSLSVCPGLSDLTWGPPGHRSPFEGGNVSCGCLAVWLGLWGPAAWELHSASSAWHWASLCPRSRRRLWQQIAVKSQGPSLAPQAKQNINEEEDSSSIPCARCTTPFQASPTPQPTLVIH